MKERLCLEVERLSLSAVIVGSGGFGASRRTNKGRLGSVSDYCVRHCVCPVVVVRYPGDVTAAVRQLQGGGRRMKLSSCTLSWKKKSTTMSPCSSKKIGHRTTCGVCTYESDAIRR